MFGQGPSRPDRAMPLLRSALVLAMPFLLCGVVIAQDAADESPVRCKVSGYDVIVYNEGTEPVPLGTVIAWSVPFARMEAEHTLTADLEPGDRVFLSGALGASFLGSSTPCSLTIGGEAGTTDTAAPATTGS